MAKTVLGGKTSVKVAAVQAAPVFFNKDKTIEKACRLIREAAANKADLIAFPETFIPGYPAYFTCGPATPNDRFLAYTLALQDNALAIPSEDTERLSAAARDAGAYVVMGLDEMDDRIGSRTIYNTLLFIGPQGEILGRHRKLMPTFIERTYWGWGSGADLRVFDTSIGRLGGLVCWENHMILVRAAMIHRAEEIHVANWPGTLGLSSPRASAAGQGRSDDGEMHVAAREHAFEAGAFVVSVHGLLRDEDLTGPWEWLRNDPAMNYRWAIGGSAIVDPMGRYLVPPTFDRETIIYADCDANMIKAAKVLFDSLGHYTRWDVVKLLVREEGLEPEQAIRDARRSASLRLPSENLRRISERFEIPLEKLESVLAEIEKAS
ncbi:MAG TPA: carbon-nitrogen hydrolase family protein [Candidatus Binataceae bacterium]|nr:carbon-nitrogen hydrolase family protein [Candidatus Binataceae bacterium]